MKTKRIALLLIVTLLSTHIVGCQKITPPKEQVTIYLRNYADHKGVYSDEEPDADYDSLTRFMADQFTSQYEKYDVTIVTEYFALEDEPKFVEEKYGQPDATDIVLQDSFVNLGHIYEGRLVPLNEIITDNLKGDLGSDFEQLNMIDGKIYTAPFGRLPTVFVYNAGLFRQAGLDEYIGGKTEISDWSIEEWNTILAALKANLPENTYPMMMYGASTNGDMVNMMLLRMFGNPFFDENGNACINDEKGIQALRWILENNEKGYYPPGAENLDLMDCFELFCNGQLAIYFGNNVIFSIFSERDIDARYVLYPSLNDRGMSFDFTYTFAVFDNNDEKRIEVSKDFLRFLYSNEELFDLNVTSGILPSLSSSAKRQKEAIPLLEEWEAIKDTKVDFTNNSPNYPGIREAFYPEITAMLANIQTPEETAQKLDEKINAAIAKGRMEGQLHN